MRTHVESSARRTTQRLADLNSRAAELERELADTRMSLECELGQCAGDHPAAHGQADGTHRCVLGDAGRGRDGGKTADFRAAPAAPAYVRTDSAGQLHSPEWRTETLVNHGRASARYSRFPRIRKLAAGMAVVAVAVAALVLLFFRNGASWPSSVATVQSEVAKACQNPDVRSEPGQVNFACAKNTRQVLWVFAMLTSANNPNFANAKTGRMGLEPITPAQGGQVAWSLNLHHPYDPTNPVDSLAVAARAINNIVGGATLTRPNGKPVVQPGLESHHANCLRYTGSAAVTARAGYPKLCARPVTSVAGQAALVTDIFQKWVVGAPPAAAQDAGLLFENANNPGDPQVQAILKRLRNSAPLA